MRTILRAVSLLLLFGATALGHRLDEYLQATLISVEQGRVQAQIRLSPGVAVLPIILGDIDTDANEAISDGEQRAYATRVLRDLSLALDGGKLPLRLVSTKFPKLAELKQGLGEIEMVFEAAVPRGGPNRKLIFENHHHSPIAAYLVNCLVPQNPAIRITAQNRNFEQSRYELTYEDAGGRAAPRFSGLSTSGAWLAMVVFALSARLMFVLRQRVRSVTTRKQPILL